jgi:hypothetical protein
MDEKQHDIEAVKARLYEYRELTKEIETQSERLERLKTRIYGVGAQSLSDMPKSPSPASDRVTDLVYQKIELENSIKETIERQRQEREYLEGVIKHLRKSEERSVIRVRYFDCASWNDVVDVLFGDKPDLLEKEDVYLRRVYKLHGQAICGMAQYIEDSTGVGRVQPNETTTTPHGEAQSDAGGCGGRADALAGQGAFYQSRSRQKSGVLSVRCEAAE